MLLPTSFFVQTGVSKTTAIRVCGDRFDFAQVLAIPRGIGTTSFLPFTSTLVMGVVTTTRGCRTRRDPFSLSLRRVFRPPFGFGAPGIPQVSPFQATVDWRGDPFSRGSKGKNKRQIGSTTDHKRTKPKHVRVTRVLHAPIRLRTASQEGKKACPRCSGTTRSSTAR